VPVTVTAPAAVPVNVTEQLADAPLPLSVQLLALKLPAAPVLVKATEPVGVVGTLEVSIRVAVHVEAWLIVTVDGEQLTFVDVECGLTVSVVLPWLVP